MSAIVPNDQGVPSSSRSGVTDPTGSRWHLVFVAACTLTVGFGAIAWWGHIIDTHARSTHKPGWWEQPHYFHGAWGDAFGPLTALFSAVTMGVAFWSLHEQRQELDVQRGIIGSQLAELKAHTSALRSANTIAVNRLRYDWVTDDARLLSAADSVVRGGDGRTDLARENMLKTLDVNALARANAVANAEHELGLEPSAQPVRVQG